MIGLGEMMRALEMMQAWGNYVPFGRCGLGDMMRAWGDEAGLGCEVGFGTCGPEKMRLGEIM